MPEKIGIMGGTFDPIHYGHLLAAEECRRAFGLERVLFIPTGMPPHKSGRKVSSTEDRYAMTLLATAGVREFTVSRTEIERPCPSRTVDTLREFLDTGFSSADLFFITGLDALLAVATWKDYLLLPSLCTLVTVTRPGYSLDDLKSLPEEIRAVVRVLEIPQYAISSTEIRDRVSKGRGVRFLVPRLVENYIESCGLYRESEVPQR